jgi:hypothetical protein
VCSGVNDAQMSIHEIGASFPVRPSRLRFCAASSSVRCVACALRNCPWLSFCSRFAFLITQDSTFGEESRIGVPFTAVLRDILQFDKVGLVGWSCLGLRLLSWLAPFGAPL